MNTLEEFTNLKAQRDLLARLTWQSGVPPTRLFYPDNGRNTQEHTWTVEINNIAQSAVGQVKYSGSNISFYGGDVLGQAIKKLVINYLDEQLQALALRGEKEAKDLLALVSIKV